METETPVLVWRALSGNVSCRLVRKELQLTWTRLLAGHSNKLGVREWLSGRNIVACC